MTAHPTLLTPLLSNVPEAACDSALNDWFLSLPQGRREMLLAGDRWALADAAFKAGQGAMQRDFAPIALSEKQKAECEWEAMASWSTWAELDPDLISGLFRSIEKKLGEMYAQAYGALPVQHKVIAERGENRLEEAVEEVRPLSVVGWRTPYREVEDAPVEYAMDDVGDGLEYHRSRVLRCGLHWVGESEPVCLLSDVVGQDLSEDQARSLFEAWASQPECQLNMTHHPEFPRTYEDYTSAWCQTAFSAGRLSLTQSRLPHRALPPAAVQSKSKPLPSDWAMMNALRSAMTQADVPACFRGPLVGFFCNEINAQLPVQSDAPFGWFIELGDADNPKAGPVYMGTSTQGVMEQVRAPENGDGVPFPLYRRSQDERGIPRVKGGASCG